MLLLHTPKALTTRLVGCSLHRCAQIAGCSSVVKIEESDGKNKKLVDAAKRKYDLASQQRKWKEMDEFTRSFVKELPNLPDNDELKAIFGSNLIRDPLNKMSVEQMESERDRVGKKVSQFRQIIYDEGELDHSDLTKPPSPDNPHPFDPSTLPPTHARSLIAYVNHFPVLQQLVDIGVNLFEVDLEPKLGQRFLRLDLEKDVKPRIAFLVREIGVELEEIGSYLTRNPYFLFQKIKDLRSRVNYLKEKKFKKDQIRKIVVAHRYWLNIDIHVVDSRLGWLQKQFHLSGDNLRALITKEPRLLIFGIGPIQRMLLMFNNNFQFEAGEIKKMLMEDPRLFMSELQQIQLSYNYLRSVMGITNELIAEYPLSLRCPISDIRKRNEFLKRLNLNQYHPDLPNYISLRKLLHPSDKYFSETVCRKFLSDYDNFLKTL